jgi:uncharacterized membrane protein
MVDEKYGKKKKAVRQKIKSVLNIDKTWSDRFALFITNLFGSVLFLMYIAVFCMDHLES